MKMFLMVVGLTFVSLGGSYSVNHSPYNLLLSIPGGVIVGLAVYWESK